MTSGVQAHGFSYSGVRPVIIAGHTPENLGFRTQFQLPVGTSTLGGRPGDFDKSFVEGQVVPVTNQKNLFKPPTFQLILCNIKKKAKKKD